MANLPRDVCRAPLDDPGFQSAWLGAMLNSVPASRPPQISIKTRQAGTDAETLKDPAHARRDGAKMYVLDDLVHLITLYCTVPRTLGYIFIDYSVENTQYIATCVSKRALNMRLNCAGWACRLIGVKRAERRNREKYTKNGEISISGPALHSA